MSYYSSGLIGEESWLREIEGLAEITQGKEWKNICSLRRLCLSPAEVQCAARQSEVRSQEEAPAPGLERRHQWSCEGSGYRGCGGGPMQRPSEIWTHI